MPTRGPPTAKLDDVRRGTPQTATASQGTGGMGYARLIGPPAAARLEDEHPGAEWQGAVRRRGLRLKFNAALLPVVALRSSRSCGSTTRMSGTVMGSRPMKSRASIAR